MGNRPPNSTARVSLGGAIYSPLCLKYENEFSRYAVNDVKVTSCSSELDRKKHLTGGRQLTLTSPMT